MNITNEITFTFSVKYEDKEFKFNIVAASEKDAKLKLKDICNLYLLEL